MIRPTLKQYLVYPGDLSDSYFVTAESAEDAARLYAEDADFTEQEVRVERVPYIAMSRCVQESDPPNVYLVTRAVQITIAPVSGGSVVYLQNTP
jgi:hypothetical protein